MGSHHVWRWWIGDWRLFAETTATVLGPFTSDKKYVLVEKAQYVHKYVIHKFIYLYSLGTLEFVDLGTIDIIKKYQNTFISKSIKIDGR